MSTTFRVNAVPVAQPRQRHRIIQGAKGAFASNYTPKSDPVNAFKAAIQAQAIEAGIRPSLKPLWLSLEFYLPRPKSHYRANGELKPSSPTYRHQKPDFDNLSKSVCDALNEIAWKDDSQVVCASVVKLYCSSDKPVGVEVTISEIDA